MIAWAALALAPLPALIAILVTERPAYPEDACFYGAPPEALRATDAYLDLIAPLAMFGLAAAVTVAARPWPRWWASAAVAFFAWAALTVFWQEASHPVMYPGGLLALFGIFLAPPLLVLTALAGRQGSWLESVAWFEALFLLPVLLGLAKVLAQPACMA